MLYRKLLKNIFRKIGLDVRRAGYTSLHTLCGLKNLDVQTILDIGANEGQFAILARDHFPNARIYSFEPLPGAFSKLRVAVGCDPRVSTFNIALGAEKGSLPFFYHSHHSPSSSFLSSTSQSHALYPQTEAQEKVEIEVTTLNDWLAALGDPLEMDVLIKLDVQGYENRVIAGGGHAFDQAAACIIEVCLDELYEGQADFRDIIQRMHDHGLEFAGSLDQAFASDGHVIFIDAVFMRRTPKRQFG